MTKEELKTLRLHDCSHCERKFRTRNLLQRHIENSHDVDLELETNFATAKIVKIRTKSERSAYVQKELFSCSYCLKQYSSKSNFEIHILSHEIGNEMQSYEYVVEDEDDETIKDEISDHETNENCLQDHEDYLGIPKSLLKNIDESLVSIVKIETETVSPEPIDEVCEGEEILINMNTDHMYDEDYLVEDSEDMNYYETIIAEELEPHSLENDDIIAYQPSNSSSPLGDSNNFDSGEEKFICLVNDGDLEVQKAKRTKTKQRSDKQSICDECGATFKNNSHLKRHIERKHRKESHSLECDVCGQKFLLNYDLKRHMVKHSSVRNFKCSLCDQQFKTNLSLKNHIKALHNSDSKLERKFSCKFCERSYFHQRHLDYHLR